MGVIQFTRLPFGSCRASSYFQEQMATTVLYGLIYNCCEMYLDDCIVYGRGEAEFLKNLRNVVRLNTRCHLLAFAAKVEKQLQATVSIQ